MVKSEIYSRRRRPKQSSAGYPYDQIGMGLPPSDTTADSPLSTSSAQAYEQFQANLACETDSPPDLSGNLVIDHEISQPPSSSVGSSPPPPLPPPEDAEG